MKSLFALRFLIKAAAVGLLAAIAIIVLLPAKENRQMPVVQINEAGGDKTQSQNNPRQLGSGPYSYAAAVEHAAPAVVNIYTARRVAEQPRILRDPLFEQFFGHPNRQPRERVETGSGSGVIINKDGYILTNYHVIGSAEQIHVMLSDGRDATAQLIGADPETDLAVLKIEAGEIIPITFNARDELAVGDVVLAIGNPFGVGQTVTMGIVSATGRDRLGLNTFENFIQTDAAINPGNSGGALVNAHGELVGINTAIFSKTGGSQGIGFAIPAGMALDVLTQIITRGKVVRGWLGISSRDLPASLRRRKNIEGVYITNVFRNGPADGAGLLPGDIIVEIEGEKIDNARTVLNIVARHQPGSELSIRAMRNGQNYQTTAVLSERPSSIKS